MNQSLSMTLHVNIQYGNILSGLWSSATPQQTYKFTILSTTKLYIL